MILFASDIHLSENAPEISRRFFAFLEKQARQADSLYLLGDLFEFWVGDDALCLPFNQSIAKALRACSAAGTKIFCLHGNRDFLLGPDFAAAAGVTLIPDPYVLSVPCWQFVLSHGDHLCTNDSGYMAFRAQTRSPDWQARFLAHPLEQRLQQAQRMREASQQQKNIKGPAAYQDLDPGATEDFLREYGYATFIHGHTHQPAHHDHIVDGIHVERWVLGDWDNQAGLTLGWDGDTLQPVNT